MTTRRQAMRACAVVAGALLMWGAAPALAHEGEEGEGRDGHVVPHAFEDFPGIHMDGGVTWFLQGTSGNGTNDGFDLTYTMDLNLVGTVSEHGHVNIALEAGNGAGVDGRLGSLSTANYDAFITELATGDNAFNSPSISQIYYEGEYADGRLMVDFGKLDVHAMYDQNAYANDETDQFLSAIFTRSAGTTYAELDQYYAPGLAVTGAVNDFLDVLALVASGVDSGFDAVSDAPYGVLQVDVKPALGGLEGNYRVYGIYDARKYTEIGTGETQANVAYGVSLDQALPGGAGLFARYSAQDDQLDENAVKSSWSLGAVLSGGAWGRDDDVIGLGYGVVVVNTRAADIAAIANPDDEGHLEAYYKLTFSDHFTVTPDVQVITGNGGDADSGTVTVAGVRAQLNF